MSSHFNPILHKTADNTHTVYLKHLNETYHSRDGALAESIHVYIENGWKMLQQRNQVNLLEVGFGTGLNALLTFEQSVKEKALVHYHCLEPYPLALDIVFNLDFGYLTQDNTLQTVFWKMHEAPFETSVQLHPSFIFTKHAATIQDVNLSLSAFDLIYYDAFSPKKQPEMWTLEVLKKTLTLLKPEGVFITYCANGDFKRNLKYLGFNIENPKGFGRRQEITRVVKR